ncbi:MAG TPA: hypothetical protein VLH79_14025 [Chthonomonadales bacterium]|nr:hypothetical protein [Chthonomonadales bacterium]
MPSVSAAPAMKALEASLLRAAERNTEVAAILLRKTLESQRQQVAALIPDAPAMLDIRA